MRKLIQEKMDEFDKKARQSYATGGFLVISTVDFDDVQHTSWELDSESVRKFVQDSLLELEDEIKQLVKNEVESLKFPNEKIYEKKVSTERVNAILDSVLKIVDGDGAKSIVKRGFSERVHSGVVQR